MPSPLDLPCVNSDLCVASSPTSVMDVLSAAFQTQAAVEGVSHPRPVMARSPRSSRISRTSPILTSRPSSLRRRSSNNLGRYRSHDGFEKSSTSRRRDSNGILLSHLVSAASNSESQLRSFESSPIVAEPTHHSPYHHHNTSLPVVLPSMTDLHIPFNTTNSTENITPTTATTATTTTAPDHSPPSPIVHCNRLTTASSLHNSRHNHSPISPGSPRKMMALIGTNSSLSINRPSGKVNKRIPGLLVPTPYSPHHLSSANTGANTGINTGTSTGALTTEKPVHQAMPITPAGLAALNGSSSGDNGDNGSGLGSPAEHRLQPLFIDMRSLPEYEKSHINQAINVNLPTLLIKRYRRGAVSNFSLENFISTPEGKEYFCRWKQQWLSNKSNNEASIVVYDEYMHEADKSSFAWTLVGVLEKCFFESPNTKPTAYPLGISNLKTIIGGNGASDNNNSSNNNGSGSGSGIGSVNVSGNSNGNVNGSGSSSGSGSCSGNDIGSKGSEGVNSSASGSAKGQIYWLEGGYAAFRQWSETVSPSRAETPPLPLPQNSFLQTDPSPKRSLSRTLLPTQSRSATTLSNPPVSTTNVQRRASLFSLDTSNVRPKATVATNRRAHGHGHSHGHGHTHTNTHAPKPTTLSTSTSASSQLLGSKTESQKPAPQALPPLPTASSSSSSSSSLASNLLKKTAGIGLARQSSKNGTWPSSSTDHLSSIAENNSLRNRPMANCVGSSRGGIGKNVGNSENYDARKQQRQQEDDEEQELEEEEEEDDDNEEEETPTEMYMTAMSGEATPESEYSFVVSEIVPGFLYLGPEITTPDQMARLAGRSIRRILNMAEECDDDVPGLKERFVYTKIAARDTVEMRNVDSTLRMAVHVIDSAKDHHEPIYVHCKAGKSRSAAAILAYLVLSEQWTLKRAYRHLIKSRPTVSPNIGFVAELMKLEESVHGQVSNFAGTDWHLIDTTHPPSPDSQREIGKLQKAWREQSNRSK